jgi:hypothetical protein
MGTMGVTKPTNIFMWGTTLGDIYQHLDLFVDANVAI